MSKKKTFKPPPSLKVGGKGLFQFIQSLVALSLDKLTYALWMAPAVIGN